MDRQTVAPVAEADLHCHLLPAWDDGPRALDESIRMSEKAAAAGIKQILVTPHVGRSFSSGLEHPACRIPEATARLEQEIRDRGIDISLIPGAELTLAEADLPERLPSEPWLTIGGQGRYILIESTFDCWPNYANQLLYQISLRGVTSIIAHPERYPDVQRDANVLANVVSRGALLQLTARSLLGDDDRRTKQCCLQLLKRGMAALVASDAHSTKSVLPGEVADILRSTVGEATARTILRDNPRRVLAGEPVYLAEPPARATHRARSWSISRLLPRGRI